MQSGANGTTIRGAPGAPKSTRSSGASGSLASSAAPRRSSASTRAAGSPSASASSAWSTPAASTRPDRTRATPKSDEEGKPTSFEPANYVLGVGRIDGRPCVVGGEDFTQRGGSPSTAGFRKSVYAEEMACRLRLAAGALPRGRRRQRARRRPSARRPLPPATRLRHAPLRLDRARAAHGAGGVGGARRGGGPAGGAARRVAPRDHDARRARRS